MIDSIAVGESEIAHPTEFASVPSDFLKIASLTPGAPAVSCHGEELTYGELLSAGSGLAAVLRGLGVGAGDRVLVRQDPSLEMIISVIGVLAAGAAYLPVDPQQPDERIRAIAADAGARVVVSDLASHTRDLGIVSLSARSADSDHWVVDGPDWAAPGPDDAAYVIYTSGSTGEPKGLAIGHRQLAYSTWARRQVYPGAARFLLVSPLAFDSSVAGIWGTLTTGGCLVVATLEERQDPSALAALIAQVKVNRTLLIPSLYRMVLDAGRSSAQRDLSSLETITVAGEQLPDSLIQAHFAVLPHTELVNEYGPSEATVWASYRRYRGVAPSTIGGPIPGARLYVLDEQLRPVATGSSGELCIGGPGVAGGYLGRPATARPAFVDDPWGKPGNLLYRSGDLARWNDDGELEFLGRADRQVKIRGHRVQLEAVEAALTSLPGVVDAAVCPDPELATLTAHVVLGDGMNVGSLRVRLAAELPPEQRPGLIHVHERLPVTVNGKVDQEALTAIARQREEPTREPAAASRPEDLTAQVMTAWQEVLGISSIPLETNFFDLGGNSLAVMKLQGTLERHTGTHMSVVSLFRHTTVAAQAILLQQQEDAETTENLAGPGRARAAGARRRRLAGDSE